MKNADKGEMFVCIDAEKLGEFDCNPNEKIYDLVAKEIKYTDSTESILDEKLKLLDMNEEEKINYFIESMKGENYEGKNYRDKV